MINKNRLKANKKSYKGNMSVKLRKKIILFIINYLWT